MCDGTLHRKYGVFTALASTCYSFLKANAMLNFNNMASAHFYAALIIHLKLHRRHPQGGQIQKISSATGAKLKLLITTAAFSLDITILVQHWYALNYPHASLALLLP